MPLEKLGTLRNDLVETSPFVYRDELLLLESVRPGMEDNARGGRHYLRIRHLADGTRDVRDSEELAAGEVLTEFGEDFTFAAPFVRGEEVFVYASLRGEDDAVLDEIHVFRSDDLRTWESALAVKGSDERLFNCSVCFDGERYVMALETDARPWPSFTITFVVSDDLLNWEVLPAEEAVLGTDRYAACPTVRFHEGRYYVWYLEHAGPWWFETWLTRSEDLLHWRQSPQNPILRPSTGEDINNSDIDFCEFHGRMVIYYAWGSQRGDEHLAHARYTGTLAEWIAECYPSA
ncbi:MAG: hypothetical protein U9R79_01710 [Armatimonadota bacterium]|nr:hypothetical protein [Armatimonadota bacterium]